MGYELKLIIGKTSSTTQPVLARSTEKYEDGSGYKYLKDAKGNVIPTGRTETWFRDMAHIDLCCIGTAPGDFAHRFAIKIFQQKILSG